MTWTLLNSKAYQSLPFAASKALPYFIGKVKTAYRDPDRFQSDFTFSYPEGKRLGFSLATFSKIIGNLVSYGFIDPIERGGLRGYQKGYNIFKLSKRWELFGTDKFEGMSWETFGMVRNRK